MLSDGSIEPVMGKGSRKRSASSEPKEHLDDFQNVIEVDERVSDKKGTTQEVLDGCGNVIKQVKKVCTMEEAENVSSKKLTRDESSQESVSEMSLNSTTDEIVSQEGVFEISINSQPDEIQIQQVEQQTFLSQLSLTPAAVRDQASDSGSEEKEKDNPKSASTPKNINIEIEDELWSGIVEPQEIFKKPSTKKKGKRQLFSEKVVEPTYTEADILTTSQKAAKAIRESARLLDAPKKPELYEQPGNVGFIMRFNEKINKGRGKIIHKYTR